MLLYNLSMVKTLVNLRMDKDLYERAKVHAGHRSFTSWVTMLIQRELSGRPSPGPVVNAGVTVEAGVYVPPIPVQTAEPTWKTTTQGARMSKTDPKPCNDGKPHDFKNGLRCFRCGKTVGEL